MRKKNGRKEGQHKKKSRKERKHGHQNVNTCTNIKLGEMYDRRGKGQEGTNARQDKRK